jgi:multiple sugar transport system permease protein
MNWLRALVIGPYFLIATLPLAWLALTSIKTTDDTISTHAKFIPRVDSMESRAGKPSVESNEESMTFAATGEAYRHLSRPVAGTPNNFYHYLVNSVIIGVLSTLAAVLLGTICAYGFSRFEIPGARDWLFFILSTRFLPPLAVVVPVLLMYRWFALENTHLGLILLYTSFNLSLAVWLMKGFIDEIPRAFEEAALIDGYSRLRAFGRVIVPQAATGMAVTAVFCLISSWNEFGFAMTLNNYDAKTVPVYFAGLQGNIEGVPWPQIAAGMMIFVAPIVLFTVLVRRHLLRGVTFGTIKQ